MSYHMSAVLEQLLGDKEETGLDSGKSEQHLVKETVTDTICLRYTHKKEPKEVTISAF